MFKFLCGVLVFFALALDVTWTFAQENPPLFKGYTSIVRIDPPQSPLMLNSPIEFVETLRINKSLEYRSAALKDQASGVLDLRRLCLNAGVEEHWAYLPEKKLWYEISFDETPGAATIDFEFLEKLIEENSQISIYHIHLRHYLEKVKKEQDIEVPETWLVVPSFPDIALMIYFDYIFSQHQPEGNMSWYVCSPLGRTKYRLNASGKEHYRTIKNNSFLLTYFYPDNSPSIKAKSVATFDLSAPHDIGDLIDWVNEQGKGYFDIEYLPYSTQRSANLLVSE